MLILNINGPINSGKTTVSKILANLFPNSFFIEVDELMTDEEQKQIGLSLQEGWAERKKRLEECLKNRGTRELDNWERNRIHQMYKAGYQNRAYSDFIINNDNQSPEQTADVIKEFILHAL